MGWVPPPPPVNASDEEMEHWRDMLDAHIGRSRASMPVYAVFLVLVIAFVVFACIRLVETAQ